MHAMIENLYRLQELEFTTKRKVPDKDAAMSKLRAAVPAPILAHYDRLRTRGKKGVSIVHNHVCSECHVRVAIGVVATLMHGDDIQLCGNCGRYLFLPENETVGLLASASDAKEEAKKRALRAPIHVH